MGRLFILTLGTALSGCDGPRLTTQAHDANESTSASPVGRPTAKAMEESSVVESSMERQLKLMATDAAPESLFGYSVAAAGDVNNDGFDDIVVGTPWDGDSGSGAAYLYLGSDGGIDRDTETKVKSSDGAQSDLFGQAVAGAGDVNGDGYDDIVVGSPRDDGIDWSTGSVYVYLGSPDGIAADTEVKVTASEPSSGAEFGHTVAGGGDLDGDGYDDIVVGAPYHANHGAAYVYLGSHAGITVESEIVLTAGGADEDDEFAYAVHGGCDVTGDGHDDVVVGSPGDDDWAVGAGAAYLFAGGIGGVDETTRDKFHSPDASQGAQFGRSVAMSGDNNGDGFCDLVAGAYTDGQVEKYAGVAYVFYGSTTGLDILLTDKLSASDGLEYDFFGSSVSGGSDQNGDGFDDIVIGAMNDDVHAEWDGSAYLYAGSPAGVQVSSQTRLSSEESRSNNFFGVSVSSAGDFNADGYGDLIVGAYENGEMGLRAGAAFLYTGNCDGLVWHQDSDSDGYGDPLVVDFACSAPGGYVTDGTDCDDDSVDVNPGGTEVCDADDIDEDCSGVADDVSAADRTVWCRDVDADGYGDPDLSEFACDEVHGWVSNCSDCNDRDAAISPDAVEFCDATDHDCDGSTEDGAIDSQSWYADHDADGFTSHSDTVRSCVAPPGYSTATALEDCDDADSSVHPGALETPDDGIDQDCFNGDLKAPADTGSLGDVLGCSGCTQASSPRLFALPTLLLLLIGWGRAERGLHRDGRRRSYPRTRRGLLP